MPTPERTSLEAIVTAARDLLEAGGEQGVTMQAVAARVGVKAPSLYKRVRDRDALVRLVAEAAVDELVARLDGASLDDLARQYRRFAHEHPQAYRLLLSADVGQEAIVRSSEPILQAARELVGDDDALDAARTLTAWANGFIGMELAGAFRLGGDVDRAFEYGLARVTRALAV